MQMNAKEYEQYAKKFEQKSPIVKNCVNAFWVGGLICTIGQLIFSRFQTLGLSKDTASLLTSASLILLSAILTGMSVYDDIARFAGAGTLVPITGFANSVVAPAMEFRFEGIVTGMAAKMFVIAGPVIVFGTSASILYGIIYFLYR